MFIKGIFPLWSRLWRVYITLKFPKNTKEANLKKKMVGVPKVQYFIQSSEFLSKQL
jgi:hypothetical protein